MKRSSWGFCGPKAICKEHGKTIFMTKARRRPRFSFHSEVKMLKDDRWVMELLIMRNSFPIMQPFSEGDRIGFRGTMRIGKKSARTNYHVSVLASKSAYPQVEPRVYVSPKPEEHHWSSSDPAYLCYQRNSAWQPGASTFAGCVAAAIKYLMEFGG
jgi:hypothetical protein